VKVGSAQPGKKSARQAKRDDEGWNSKNAFLVSPIFRTFFMRFYGELLSMGAKGERHVE
jgi:hypothetical protein